MTDSNARGITHTATAAGAAITAAPAGAKGAKGVSKIATVSRERAARCPAGSPGCNVGSGGGNHSGAVGDIGGCGTCLRTNGAAHGSLGVTGCPTYCEEREHNGIGSGGDGPRPRDIWLTDPWDVSLDGLSMLTLGIVVVAVQVRL